MKDNHLTLRLPAALGDALDARASAAGVPKSQVVREAVARYLAPTTAQPEPRLVTARALAAKWQMLPHLDEADAESFRDDLADDRQAMPLPDSLWA